MAAIMELTISGFHITGTNKWGAEMRIGDWYTARKYLTKCPVLVPAPQLSNLVI